MWLIIYKYFSGNMLRNCYGINTHSCQGQNQKWKPFLILFDSRCVLCSRRRCLHHGPLISTHDTLADACTHFSFLFAQSWKHLPPFDKKAVSGTGCWLLFHAHSSSCWSFSLAVLVVCDSGDIWAWSHCTMGNENSSADLPVRMRMLGPASCAA